MTVNVEDGELREVFDHARLAQEINKVNEEEVSAEALPLSKLAWEAESLTFSAWNKKWICDLSKYQVLLSESVAEANGTTVKVLDREQVQGNTGETTRVRFVNRTESPIKLFWVMQPGQRRDYGEIAPGEEYDQHTYENHVWLVTDAEEKPLGIYQATEVAGVAVVDGSWKPKKKPWARSEQKTSSDHSPDGRWRAEISENNVVLNDIHSKERVTITTDGKDDGYYLPRFIWSPSSRYLVVLREEPGEQREVTFVESSPKEQLQPIVHTFSYAKPGDRLPKQLVVLIDIEAQAVTEVDDTLYSNPFVLGQFKWSQDSTSFSFLYNQRGHQVLRLVSVDAASGDARTVIDETSDTFICYSRKTYLKRLEKTDEIVWMSERDGWNHLYLYDSDSGEVLNQVTKGEWVVRGVDRVDEEKRQIWFHAGGIYPEQDPYHIHFCRVNFDGTGLTVLTEGDGTHSVEYSPEGNYFVDRYSRADLPAVTELRRSSNGSLVTTLQEADWSSLIEAGWQPPIRFTAEGRDGQTDIYGLIYRPSNFDPTKQYPVIENIYAGPHSAHVPKRFSYRHRGQKLAELGFIVVRIDGMGTSQRSKAFHDVCWQDIADAGFPDRIAWMKAAAKKYPWMDISRVGIYGGSAGGQNAMRALIDHGDFYQAAVADCGCHDNRMDKIWWNEQWMGWPIGPHYEASSNVAHAHRMQGKLLLTVGEVDSNVDPASTMQVVDALIKADKDFDLIVFPSANHGAGGSEYGVRRRRDFFVRHLMGVEPRWEE